MYIYVHTHICVSVCVLNLQRYILIRVLQDVVVSGHIVVTLKRVLAGLVIGTESSRAVSALVAAKVFVPMSTSLASRAATVLKQDGKGDDELFWGDGQGGSLPKASVLAGKKHKASIPKRPNDAQRTAQAGSRRPGANGVVEVCAAGVFGGVASSSAAASSPRPTATWVNPTGGGGHETLSLPVPGAFSLLDFAPIARKPKSKLKRGALQESTHESESKHESESTLHSEAVQLWGRCTSVGASSASPPLPSLASIQAEEERSVDPHKLRRVKQHNKVLSSTLPLHLWSPIAAVPDNKRFRQIHKHVVCTVAAEAAVCTMCLGKWWCQVELCPSLSLIGPMFKYHSCHFFSQNPLQKER